MSGSEQQSASDVGTAGLLALVACVITLTCGFALMSLTQIAYVHARSDSAADLTALAVADAMLLTEDPCVAGARTANENDAVLQSCQLNGLTVRVETSTRLPRSLERLTGRTWVYATARAELPTHWPAVPGPMR